MKSKNTAVSVLLTNLVVNRSLQHQTFIVHQAYFGSEGAKHMNADWSFLSVLRKSSTAVFTLKKTVKIKTKKLKIKKIKIEIKIKNGPTHPTHTRGWMITFIWNRTEEFFRLSRLIYIPQSILLKIICRSPHCWFVQPCRWHFLQYGTVIQWFMLLPLGSRNSVTISNSPGALVSSYMPMMCWLLD